MISNRFVFVLGGDDDVETAKEFMKNKYLSFVLVIEGMKKCINPHYTCSNWYILHSENIYIIYNEVKEQIFDELIHHL